MEYEYGSAEVLQVQYAAAAPHNIKLTVQPFAIMHRLKVKPPRPLMRLLKEHSKITGCHCPPQLQAPCTEQLVIRGPEKRII